jgi:hypothetical protein
MVNGTLRILRSGSQEFPPRSQSQVPDILWLPVRRSDRAKINSRPGFWGYDRHRVSTIFTGYPPPPRIFGVIGLAWHEYTRHTCVFYITLVDSTAWNIFPSGAGVRDVDTILSILQNIFANWIYDVLFLAGGGALLGYLKAKKLDFTPIVLYVMAGVTCVAIVLFTLTGRPLLSRPLQQSTPDNVEANIKAWSDDLGFAVAKAQAVPPGASFALLVTLASGNPIVVARINQMPNYVQLSCGLVLSPEHHAAMAKLSKGQADAVKQEVILELALSRMGYTTMEQQGNSQLQSIVLSKSIPIADLAEPGFLGYMNEMDSAVSLARAATILALKHNGQLQDVPTVVTQH